MSNLCSVSQRISKMKRQTGVPAANWILPPKSSHPVASLASQSSRTQKTPPNHPRLAAICPSKPSSPNARSKSACDNALGKGLTTMPVMSAWHGRHLKPALNLLVAGNRLQKTEAASKLCVYILYNSKPQVRQQGITSSIYLYHHDSWWQTLHTT